MMHEIMESCQGVLLGAIQGFRLHAYEHGQPQVRGSGTRHGQLCTVENSRDESVKR